MEESDGSPMIQYFLDNTKTRYWVLGLGSPLQDSHLPNWCEPNTGPPGCSGTGAPAQWGDPEVQGSLVKGRLQEHLRAALFCLQPGYWQYRVRLCHGGWMTHQAQATGSKFKLEIKGSLSPTGTVQQWCRLHKSAVWSLLLEFKDRLQKALSHVVWHLCWPCFEYKVIPETPKTFLSFAVVSASVLASCNAKLNVWWDPYLFIYFNLVNLVGDQIPTNLIYKLTACFQTYFHGRKTQKSEIHINLNTQACMVSSSMLLEIREDGLS